jgi:hypothetical protein
MFEIYYQPGFLNDKYPLLYKQEQKRDTKGKEIDFEIPTSGLYIPDALYQIDFGVKVNREQSHQKSKTNYSYSFYEADKVTKRTVSGNTADSTKDTDRVNVELSATVPLLNNLDVRFYFKGKTENVKEEQVLRKYVWNGEQAVPNPRGTERYTHSYRNYGLGGGLEVYGLLRSGRGFGLEPHKWWSFNINRFAYLGALEFNRYNENIAPQYYQDNYKIDLSSGQKSNWDARAQGALLLDMSKQVKDLNIGLANTLGINYTYSTHSDVVLNSTATDNTGKKTGTAYSWAGKYYKHETGLFWQPALQLEYDRYLLKAGYHLSWRSNVYLTTQNDFVKQYLLEQYFPMQLGVKFPGLGLKVLGDITFKLPVRIYGEQQDRSALGQGIDKHPYNALGARVKYSNLDWGAELSAGARNPFAPSVTKIQNDLLDSRSTTYTDKWDKYINLEFTIKME